MSRILLSRLFWLVCFALMRPDVCSGASGPQGQSSPATQQTPETVSGGPYCGVYSVYAALRVLGFEVKFADLLEHEYVGSFEGSTLDELRRAVVDHGGHAEAMQGLTAASLRASPHPIILHVRRPGLNAPYAHWILFLGVEDGQARIVDPPHAVQLIPLAELLSLCDGVGLVVSREPDKGWSLRAAAWFEGGVILLLVSVCLLALRGIAGRQALARRAIWGFAVVPVVVAVAVICHLLLETGLLHNRVAVAQVVGLHFEPELPDLSVAEVESLIDQPDVTFIDARLPQDYALGHIKGAVNLPVHAGLVERSEMLAAVKPGKRIVVYCQSDGCDWGKSLASDLALRGYGNVHVFTEGWHGWKQHERRKSKR